MAGAALTLTADQIRQARTLLEWTLPTLATRAMLSFDEVTMAQDDIAIRRLGGLHLVAVREAFETAGVDFVSQSSGGPGVRLRKSEKRIGDL